MKQRLKRIGLITVGWAFIVLGIAGLFLPVLQGILFLLVGLLILSTEYAWAHNLLQNLRRRFPRIAAQMDLAKQKADRWIHRNRDKNPEPQCRND
ncbi:MAG TPA: PGPGW domain-containing protein [Terriglobales bacterium]|nr:PGPGW domain-containing protein [Terriglobales bacterium]